MTGHGSGRPSPLGCRHELRHVNSPRTRMVFRDKSSVTWEDVKTLRYDEGPYVARVSVDQEPGPLPRGRILRRHSISEWEVFPPGEGGDIPDDKREDIISKVCAYLGSGRVRIEP